ncbi:MAG: type I glyceraldehyde-3-phosphate dehydrogenase [Candidatus Bipolaricaulia bacterium]
MKRVAINGFGRIGRAFFRLAFGHEEIEIVAVNDPFIKPEMARYLLIHDSVYGRYGETVVATDDKPELIVEGRVVPLLKEKNPDELPWGEYKIDLVVEATGIFRALDGPKGASRHLAAGAKRVLQTVPCKGEGAERIPQIVYGINHDAIGPETAVISAASCTTNSFVPVIYVIEKEFGVERAFLSTVHGYTADQKLVDSSHDSSISRSRAAAINIIPTTTGAALATAKVIPSLKGKMDGIAFRVPVATGSVSDITIETMRPVSKDDVNKALRRYADGELSGILGISDDPMVSSDIIADPRPSVVDPSLTSVVDERMLKVVAFYDNEWGYTNQVLRLILAL